MEGLYLSIIRTAASFILLVLFTAAVGKHINAHKNHYNFALNITIGSFIANMGFNTSLSYVNMFMGFISLIVLFYLFLLLSSKSRFFRRWLSGHPTVLIERGRILEANLKKAKFTLDDLNQLARERGVFNLFEIDHATLEPSGELSILKKRGFQTPTINDLNMPIDSNLLPIELIIDGKIKPNTPFNQKWIEAECSKRNILVEDIYYAVVNSKGDLFLDTYRD